ncbi:MAG TPA: hypothetical protein VFI11_00385 [Anaerolineales bacterium]|nr:hypothetical protein [Anaerolineales bacterium]
MHQPSSRGRVCMAIAFLSFAAAACAPAQPTAIAPVPRLITPPYALPMVRQWAESYAAEIDTALPFDVEADTLESALDVVEESPGSVLIFSGTPPESWFVTPVASLPATFVVHPDNPVTDLRIRDLENLFTRRTADWSTLGGLSVGVQPVLPLPGEPVRDWFESIILRGSAPWPGTWLAPTPQSAYELVGSDPGAIGLILGSEAPETVRAVRIAGRLATVDPVGAGYPFILDLLAFAPEGPRGGLRDFLVWLQEQ